MGEDDALTQTRLDVAEMKGMLRQALSDHGQRISNVEREVVALHGRVSDKGKTLAAHGERIEDLENTNASRPGLIFGLVGAIVGASGLILAILNRVTII
jgi:hypothetical protein